MASEYVTKNHAARMLHVGVKGIVKICDRNGIRANIIPGHRIIYYRRDAIEKLARAAGMLPATKGAK